MGIVDLDWEGKTKFNINSIMTEIHYIKTWYDSLFYNNKIDILKLIADKSYGYKINTHEWIHDDKYYEFGSCICDNIVTLDHVPFVKLLETSEVIKIIEILRAV